MIDIDIILRACDENKSSRCRRGDMEKPVVLRQGVYSLQHSMARAEENEINCQIHVVADNLSDESYRVIEDIDPVWVSDRKFGNDASLREAFGRASEIASEGTDVIYMVEDDYYHFFPAITEIAHSVADDGRCVHPTDYPDYYQRTMDKKGLYLIELGHRIHWRECLSTTFTFAARPELFTKHHDLLLQTCNGADDNMLSSVLKEKESLWSPIPTLAAHLHERTIPPLLRPNRFLDCFRDQVEL